MKSKRRQKNKMKDPKCSHPLAKSLDDLFPRLLVTNLITKMSQRAVLKHLPKFFDHNTQCQYQSCEVRHDTNNCWSLKRRIHELIDSGSLTV